MEKLLSRRRLDNLPIQKDVFDGESGLYIYKCSPATIFWCIDPLANHLFLCGPKIGTYPEMSLAQARAAYLEYLTNIRNEVTHKIQYELDKVSHES